MELFMMWSPIELKFRAPDLVAQRVDLVIAARNIVAIVEEEEEVL
jgi:hypothetical protein